jgi:hypothetical protein
VQDGADDVAHAGRVGEERERVLGRVARFHA